MKNQILLILAAALAAAPGALAQSPRPDSREASETLYPWFQERNDQPQRTQPDQPERPERPQDPVRNAANQAGKTAGQIAAAQSKAFAAGFSKGYTEGYSKGFADGFNTGFAEGFSEGFSEGLASPDMQHGATSDGSEIRDEEFSQGFARGFAEGFAGAVSETRNGVNPAPNRLREAAAAGSSAVHGSAEAAGAVAKGAVKGAAAAAASRNAVRNGAASEKRASDRPATVVKAPARTSSAYPAATPSEKVRIASQEHKPGKQRFLPMRRRTDREINKGRFAYKGEFIAGLTASYGTLSSDETEYFAILKNLDLDGTLTTVKPFVGYLYRNNRCIGIRFGYEHMDGRLGNLDLDLGEQNDISLNVADMAIDNDSYTFALFHRAYVGIDRRGRFGLFAEAEASTTIGSGNFIDKSGETPKATYSDNFRFKLAFNPGMAVYIFPNVCATVSLGFGGFQYSSVTQHDADGVETGSRRASKMQFRLNIADINLGLAIHLWKKQQKD